MKESGRRREDVSVFKGKNRSDDNKKDSNASTDFIPKVSFNNQPDGSIIALHRPTSGMKGLTSMRS